MLLSSRMLQQWDRSTRGAREERVCDRYSDFAFEKKAFDKRLTRLDHLVGAHSSDFDLFNFGVTSRREFCLNPRHRGQAGFDLFDKLIDKPKRDVDVGEASTQWVTKITVTRKIKERLLSIIIATVYHP